MESAEIEEKAKKFEKKILKGNKKYAEKHGKTHEPEEAKSHTIIITCIDYRIDTNDFLGLKPSDRTFVFRNAGARVSDDAIRSILLVVRLFAVDQIIVIPHTQCAMEKVSDKKVRELLRESLGPGHLHGDTASGKHNRDEFHQSDYISFLAFENVEQSVRNDIAKLKQNPLISQNIAISGYVYDVDTGEIKSVVLP